MLGIAELQRVNSRKYNAAIRWSKRKEQDVEVTVFVNKDSIRVAYGKDAPYPSQDQSVLYISRSVEGFYINHEAGFQRWHKDECTYRETLGYAKQAGVSLAQFREAFGKES